MKRIIISAAAAGMLAAATTGMARTTNTFTGNDGTSWHNNLNWTQGHQPTFGEKTPSFPCRSPASSALTTPKPAP